ncbi:hypothetical protein HN51_012281, partial [Arachis hypogaea]
QNVDEAAEKLRAKGIEVLALVCHVSNDQQRKDLIQKTTQCATSQYSEKGKGWKRFEFDKDAPLEDEKIEVAEDDASLVKQIGQSFR